MTFFDYLLAYTGAIALLIAVHECGHYAAGALAGIPMREMRVRLLVFPQHVALREGGRWVSPGEPEPYFAAMLRHLRTSPRLYVYAAGGLLAESAVTTAACLGLLAAGRPRFASVLAEMSLWLFAAGVVVVDLLPAWRAGRPMGDVSGMWAVAKVPTAALLAALLALRLWLLWLTR